METIDHQTTHSGVRGDKSQRRRKVILPGNELMEHAALAAIADQIVVDLGKELRGQILQLRTHLVRDSGGSPKGIIGLAMEAMAPDLAACRQGLVVGSDYFGQDQVVGSPGDNVAGGGDPEGQDIIVLADDTAHQRFVELGVDLSTVKVQRHFSHGRAIQRVCQASPSIQGKSS